jgi:xanthine dehydrogenase FAD-binding subunit
MIKNFIYTKPGSLSEAISLLQKKNTFPLAGGTDLIADLRGGVKKAEYVVDIKGLDGLDVLTFSLEKGAKIGALVTLNAIIESKDIRNALPILCDAAFSIATYQIRNRATLMGNICNASPAADMLPALYVLGARVSIKGPEGERLIPISDFVKGVKKTALKKGEIAVEAQIPAQGKAKMAFLKQQRVKGHDLALVNAAGIAHAESRSLRICVGACSPTPVLLEGTDALYRETEDVEKLSARMADLAISSIAPVDDVRASAEYRRDIVGVLVKRIVQRVCNNRGERYA